jgi:formate dehydrogenase iron-sulfur subunit
MTVKVFIPRDTATRALGGEAVASVLVQQAGEQGAAMELVRNGSRGLFWLEPMVEVETPGGRVAYGPVTERDVPSLLEAGILNGCDQHPLYLGKPEEIPYLKNQ